MDLSGYPRVVNLDNLPREDIMAHLYQFDESCLDHAYTAHRKYSLNALPDSNAFFDRPLASIEISGYPSKPQAFFNPTIPTTSIPTIKSNPAFQRIFNPAPCGQINQHTSDFSLNPTPLKSNELACFPLGTHTSSQLPSLCGGVSQRVTPSSSSLSPRLIKREPPSSPNPFSLDVPSNHLERKHRCPQLSHNNTAPHFPSSTASTGRHQHSARQQHNQVECKYRQGLNSALEKLRSAVPALAQTEVGGMMISPPRSSKVMVLLDAVSYIRRLEKERDVLKKENERLRLRQRGGRGIGERGCAGSDKTLEEWLMDV